jgi:phosphoribosylformylglycinamidine synthase
VGLLEDLSDRVCQWFRKEGDAVLLAGADRNAVELGGSLYLKTVHGKVAGVPPAVDLEHEARLGDFLRAAAKARLLASAHDLSDGGLAVAVAESCLGGRLGAELRLDGLADRLGSPDASGTAFRLLFNEACGRILVSVRPEDRERFEATMAGSPHLLVGRTTGEPRLRALFAGEAVLDSPLRDIEKAWKTAII